MVALFAANGGGVTEVGDSHCEYNEAGAKQSEFDIGQSNVGELTPTRRSQHFGGFVNSGVSAAQRCGDDQNSLRQRVKAVSDQKSPEAVDVDLDAGRLGQ